MRSMMDGADTQVHPEVLAHKITKAESKNDKITALFWFPLD